MAHGPWLSLIPLISHYAFPLFLSFPPSIPLFLFCPFLHLFLSLRCGSKQGEEDYRPLFENFVQDLLSTVNKPEWPAAELLLSLLGRLLVSMTMQLFVLPSVSENRWSWLIAGEGFTIIWQKGNLLTLRNGQRMLLLIIWKKHTPVLCIFCILSINVLVPEEISIIYILDFVLAQMSAINRIMFWYVAVKYEMWNMILNAKCSRILFCLCLQMKVILVLKCNMIIISHWHLFFWSFFLSLSALIRYTSLVISRQRWLWE